MSAKREQRLLHSCVPQSSWLSGKPCLCPPGGWLLGRVVPPWQLMRVRINSWEKWQLKYKSELNVLNMLSFLDWKPKIWFISNKYESYNTFILQNISATSLKKIPPSLYLFCNYEELCMHTSQLMICKTMYKKGIAVIQKQVEKFLASIYPGHMYLYSNISHATLYFVMTLCSLLRKRN